MSLQIAYEQSELEAALKRAFVDGRADNIIIDGHATRSRFLREAIQYGINRGLLKRGEDIDEDKVLGRGMGQYFAYTYRLTDEGKKHFGITN